MSSRAVRRLGIAGAGWVTQHHLAAWALQHERVQVVAICDPDRGRAEARAAEFGIDGVFTDPGEMLAQSRLDALDVATPREAHEAWVRAAAARRLDIFCQKPLAPTWAEASALVRDVAGQCRLMVHENWRFRPYYRQIGQWLREGRIGTLQQAQVTLLTSGLVADARGVYPALERQPFVAGLDRALVMEILIHHIDTLRFLLGEMKLMHARLGHTCPAMRGEDRAFLSFETAGGTPVGMIANLAVHGELPTLKDKLVLIGERGTIRLDGESLVCEGESPAALTYDVAQVYKASYEGAVSHFLDCLESGAPFETAAADNLHTLKLVEDIYTRGVS